MQYPSTKLLEKNPDHCYEACVRHCTMVQREDWEDDRGNLSAFWYTHAGIDYCFELLNGELVEAHWLPSKGNDKENICMNTYKIKQVFSEISQEIYIVEADSEMQAAVLVELGRAELVESEVVDSTRVLREVEVISA